MITILNLYTRFIDLSWWQMGLWIIYFIYFGVKAKWFWDATSRYGLKKGYKEVIFDSERIFRVYHIILIIFDIPPALLGLTFPFLRKILSYKIYEFAPENPIQYEYLITLKDEEYEFVKGKVYAASSMEAIEEFNKEKKLPSQILCAYKL